MSVLGRPGVTAVASYAPREFLKTEQGAIRDAGVIGNWSRDKFGGADSMVLRAGTILGYATNSGVYVPILGAEATTPVAIGSNVVYVNCATQFTVGDNLKIGKPGQGAADTLTQDVGAIASVYTTSKTLTVTADTKIISVIATNDYAYVEPATADGTADAVAILADTIEVRNTKGTPIDVEGGIVKAGYVKTKKLLALSARAKAELSGAFTDATGAKFLFDDVGS